MTVRHPETYDNAKSLEAHLLDAHGVSVMTRDSLVSLIELHDSLHSANPPTMAHNDAPVQMRYDHVHGDQPAHPAPRTLGDLIHALTECAEVIDTGLDTPVLRSGGEDPFANINFTVEVQHGDRRSKSTIVVLR